MASSAEAALALLGVLDRFLESSGRAAAIRRKEAALRPIRRQLRGQLAAAFRAQGKGVLAALEQFRDRLTPPGPASEALREAAMPPQDWEWDLLFRQLPEEIRALFEGPLAAAAAASLLAGGQGAMRDLGFEGTLRFDLKNPRAVDYLRNYAADLVTRVDDTTKAELRSLVTGGVEQGHSYGKIAQAIWDRYAEMGSPKPQAHVRDRATLIALTETGNGYEASGQMVAEDLMAGGLPMEKFWQTLGDERVSDGCRANEAAGWIPAEQVFPSGHARPLRFPGCRCTALYRRAKGERRQSGAAGISLAPAGSQTQPARQPRHVLGFSFNQETLTSVARARQIGDGEEG